MSDQKRIIELQKSLKIARQALKGIRDGYHMPEALDIMENYAKKAKLQGLVGREPRTRR